MRRAFVIDVVRHFLVGNLPEQFRAQRVARQNVMRIDGDFIEFEDVAEVLCGPLAIHELAGLMATRAVLVENIERCFGGRIGGRHERFHGGCTRRLRILRQRRVRHTER